ncbi:hypothetical protein [Sphingobacterium detergens]|nr:hypothetical protein [Sphingobacterium detergens]
MNKIIAFVLFWAGLLPMGFANNSYVDSLQNLLKTNLTATEQVSLQQQLADWYRANEQYPQAIQMAQNSLKSARRISKNNLEMTKSYWILSNIYTNTQDFEKSQKFIDSAYHSAQNQKIPLQQPMQTMHQLYYTQHSLTVKKQCNCYIRRFRRLVTRSENLF